MIVDVVDKCVVLLSISATDSEAMISGNEKVPSVIAYEPWPDNGRGHYIQINMTDRVPIKEEVASIHVFSGYVGYFGVTQAFQKLVEIGMIKSIL